MILQKRLKKSIFGGLFRFIPVALLASASDAALLWGIRAFMRILSGEPVVGLTEWIALMLLLTALRFVFMLWKVRISEKWAYGVGALVMGWFLRTLRNLAPSNFHGPEGERAVESAYESTQVLQSNSSVCFQAVQAVLQLVVFLPVLFYISWPLTLFLFVVVVPLIGWMQRKIHRMGPEEESLLEARAVFRQDLGLARKLFRRWSSRYERNHVSGGLMQSVRSLRERGLSTSVRKGALSLTAETVSVLAMVVVLAFCAKLISSGWMDGTGLVLFCSAVLLCYKPVKECARVVPQMRASATAYNVLVRFGNLPKRKPCGGNRDDGLHVDDGRFQYEGSDAALFRGISFSWDRSKPVLLRGRNGVGKSTLLRLAAGLEEWQGDAKMPRDVFFVAQDLELPPRFILQELLKRKSGTIDKFIQASGTEKLVPRESLSGGQRARVALLWALASDSSTVLLDEPFASIALADREPLLVSFLDAAAALHKWTIVVSHDSLGASVEERFRVVDMEALVGGGVVEG